MRKIVNIPAYRWLLIFVMVLSSHASYAETCKDAGKCKSTEFNGKAQCEDKENRGISRLHVTDITGLYMNSVKGLPAYAWKSEEEREGFNYLAITQEKNGGLKVRVATKEINGHDCNVDSEARLCGSIIYLVPNEDEMKILKDRNLSPPKLKISANKIAFMASPDGTYVWGSPYCGESGYLRQEFPRKTRKKKFSNEVFGQ